MGSVDLYDLSVTLGVGLEIQTLNMINTTTARTDLHEILLLHLYNIKHYVGLINNFFVP